ncbi:MAG: hypothetical protein OEZ13_12950, partial [Spirochaetia bacterium]|nr:hypothetical protein [Spirochaetia bacterium]
MKTKHFVNRIILPVLIIAIAHLLNCAEKQYIPEETTSSTYSIGGSVTGVSAGTLVLQNNAGDNLTITADGNFTFAAQLTSGSAYD